MPKILITGGSGFIGTHLVETLLLNGSDVLSLDWSEPKIEKHVKNWKKVDICDLEKLKEYILEFSPDYVIHLAARTDLRGLTLNDYKANTDGVENLLIVLKTLPKLKKAIFASSMYVCRPGYAPTNFDDYNPHTVYGESKVITEKIIKKSNPKYTWSIIRPTSIWGPYFGEPYDLFFKIVLSKKYFHLGEKACKKTYGYIDNAVFQILSILDISDDKVDGKTFYIGDYEPYDITEWANEIAAYVNIKIPSIPYFFFQIAAYFGDLLKKIGVAFPMTSFRLKNMTTDNIHDLKMIQEIAPSLPTLRSEGTKKTIDWVKRNI